MKPDNLHINQTRIIDDLSDVTWLLFCDGFTILDITSNVEIPKKYEHKTIIHILKYEDSKNVNSICEYVIRQEIKQEIEWHINNNKQKNGWNPLKFEIFILYITNIKNLTQITEFSVNEDIMCPWCCNLIHEYPTMYNGLTVPSRYRKDKIIPANKFIQHNRKKENDDNRLKT